MGRTPCRFCAPIPAKRPPYPFAPEGERSVARAYLKAFRRARRLVYLEDQYLWSSHAAHALADALRRHRELHVVAVVPRYPDRGGRATSAASRIGREYAIDILRRAGGDRVAVYDLENADGNTDLRARQGLRHRRRPLGRRLRQPQPAFVDPRLGDLVLGDRRRSSTSARPTDPGGLGDGARRLARDTRLQPLARAPRARRRRRRRPRRPGAGFAALARSAAALDAWHDSGKSGPRPPGHLRRHHPEHVRPVGETARSVCVCLRVLFFFFSLTRDPLSPTDPPAVFAARSM